MKILKIMSYIIFVYFIVIFTPLLLLLILLLLLFIELLQSCIRFLLLFIPLFLLFIPLFPLFLPLLFIPLFLLFIPLFLLSRWMASKWMCRGELTLVFASRWTNAGLWSLQTLGSGPVTMDDILWVTGLIRFINCSSFRTKNKRLFIGQYISCSDIFFLFQRCDYIMQKFPYLINKMNGILGQDSALVRLYWAEDSMS